MENQNSPKTFAEQPLDCNVTASVPSKVRKLSQTLCRYYNHAIEILPYLEENDQFNKPRTIKILSSEIARLIPHHVVVLRGLSASSIKTFTYHGFESIEWNEFLSIFTTAKEDTLGSPNYLYTINDRSVTLPGLLKTAIANVATNYLQAPDPSMTSPPTQSDIIKGMNVLQNQFEKAFKNLPKAYRPALDQESGDVVKFSIPLTDRFQKLMTVISGYMQKNQLDSIIITPFQGTLNIDPPDSVNLRHINDENFWFKVLVNKKMTYTSDEYQPFIHEIAFHHLVPSHAQHFTDPFHWIVLAKMYTIWHADFKTDRPKHRRLDEIKDQDPYIGYIGVTTEDGSVKRKSLVDVLYDAMTVIDHQSQQKNKDARGIQVIVGANLDKAIDNFKSLIQ